MRERIRTVGPAGWNSTIRQTADRCSWPDKKSAPIVLSSPAGLSVGQTVLLSLYYDYPSEGSSKGRESCTVSSSLFQHELSVQKDSGGQFSLPSTKSWHRAEKGNERDCRDQELIQDQIFSFFSLSLSLFMNIFCERVLSRSVDD